MKTLSRYPEYKASGVEWLGEIPAHWQVKRLKYAVHLNPDTLPETTDPDYALQYLDIGNVEEVGGINPPQAMHFADAPSRARRRVLSGDTIISTVRTYLKAIAHFENPPDNLIVSTGFAVLRPTAQAAPKFLHALVRCGVFVEKVVARSVGVGYPAINPTELSCLPVWLPPLEEQSVIAEFLDRETARIDALVSKKERLIALLQEKRTALISHAVTKGLNPNAPMKDSGVEWLGQIPMHWEIWPVKYVAQFINGAAFKPTDWGSEGVPIIRIENLNGGEEFNRTTLAAPPKCHVQKGDILFGWSGNRGTSFGPFIWEQEGHYYLNQHIFRLEDFDSHRRWLYWMLKAVTLYVEQQAHGIIGMVHITKGDLGVIKVPMPPKTEQQATAEFLDRETAKLDVLSAKIRTGIERLQEYRTALISAAVTGKIDVRKEAA